jgi:hypothetical protein
MKHEDSKWLRCVNSLLLKYLLKRRIDEQFKGDISLCERRAECHNLAKFFTDLEAEGDADATVAELQIRFDRLMARILDLPQAVAA